MLPTKRFSLILTISGCIMVLGLFFLEKEAFQLPFGMHETADDPSYLRPAENWINHGVWKDNTNGASAYVQRPPLFGTVYALVYSIGGKSAPLVLFLFNFALHLFALHLLYQLICEYFTPRKALYFSLIYAITPIFFGFLSYQISEAFAGSFMIIGVYLFTRPTFPRYKASVFIIALMLFRPVLILLFLPAFLFLLLSKTNKNRLNWRQISLLGFSLIACLSWEIRKHHYTQEWLNPHPIYHASNESQFRPLHAAFSDLFRIWETRPEVFHTLMGKAWSSDTIAYKTVLEYSQARSIPISARHLHQLLKQYQTINIELKKQFEQHEFKVETSSEKQLGKQIIHLTTQIKAANPWTNWIKTPFLGMKEQLFKSHLNLGIFQETYRGTFLVESLRYACLAFVLLLYLSLIFGLFIKGILRFLAIGGLIYLTYLFWFQRMNEDRYLQPVLCFAFIIGIGSLKRLHTYYQQKKVR